VEKKQSKSAQIILNVIAIIYAACCIIPIIVIISGSFTNEFSLNDHGYSLWPRHFDLTAYMYIFKNPLTIIRSYGVTIIVTAATTVVGVLCMTMVGYVLARQNCSFRRVLAFYIFFTMLFSGGLVPSYILTTQYLNLRDNILVMILPSLINPFYVIMLRTFIQKLPMSIFESAKIDGANELIIFSKIALPLSIPSIATVAFFTAMAKWNDWYTALLYINDETLVPLQYMLYRIQSNVQALLNSMQSSGTVTVDVTKIPGQNLVLAMAVVASGPMLIVFPFFQKYFISGLTVGAVKG
jgi:ABC-type sugar transport system, permease component